MNEQVSGYINQAPEEQSKIMEKVRKILHENVKGVQEELKWNRPVFKKETDIMYFKTAKSYVTIGFFQYHKLHDSQNLLEGTGKDMRHVKIRKQEDVDEALFKRWFRELTS